jgi:hypothetical protein
MFKFVSTTIIAASLAVCSFSAAAGSHVSERDKETMRKESLSDPDAPENTSKKEGHEYDAKTRGPSEKERKTMRDETMGKKTMSKEMTGKEKQ